jgi:hypothetical protein
VREALPLVGIVAALAGIAFNFFMRRRLLEKLEAEAERRTPPKEDYRRAMAVLAALQVVVISMTLSSSPGEGASWLYF